MKKIKIACAIGLSALAAVTVAACGSDHKTEAQKAIEESSAAVEESTFRMQVSDQQAALARYCLAGYYSDNVHPHRNVDRLIALLRKDPEREYDGLTMRQMVGDTAAELIDCDPDLAYELEMALDTLE